MLDESKTSFESLVAFIRKITKEGALLDEEQAYVPKLLMTTEKAFNTEYTQFIKAFNQITKKKYDADVETWTLFYDNKIHSLDDKLKAVRNIITDPWVQDGRLAMITPKYILDKDRISKYRDYKATGNNKSKDKDKENESSYTTEQNI